MARNGKSFQMGRFSSKTYISLAIFAAFLIFILFGLKRKKPVLVHDDLLENLQSHIDEQNVVIQEWAKHRVKGVIGLINVIEIIPLVAKFCFIFDMVREVHV